MPGAKQHYLAESITRMGQFDTRYKRWAQATGGGTKHQHQEEGDETLTGSEMHWIGFKDRPAPEGQKSL